MHRASDTHVSERVEGGTLHLISADGLLILFYTLWCATSTHCSRPVISQMRRALLSLYSTFLAIVDGNMELEAMYVAYSTSS